MKKYNFKLIKEWIQENSDKILSAELGMKEDWWWTAETVYEDGKFTKDLDAGGLLIAGIDGSKWATPVMRVTYKDETVAYKNVFEGESSGPRNPYFSLGCMSDPAQSGIDEEYAQKLIE